MSSTMPLRRMERDTGFVTVLRNMILLNRILMRIHVKRIYMMVNPVRRIIIIRVRRN